MSVLRFERVSYRYPDAPGDALREVSLTVAPGEFCVLAGLSGSGKSTLLRAAAGLVPHFHGGSFSGTVTVGGLDTRRHSPAEIGALAGTLLQDPETQVIMSTVRAELALALENLGHSGAAVARAVEETSLALGIAHLLDRATAELSGGELQRVALAAALVSRPPLVLLDEPTSQLDPVAGDELIWQLRRLNQESDTAVLLIEHRLERCLAAADRVIVIAHGAVACDRDPTGFLEWAAENEPALQTPGARLFEQVGLRPLPTGVKQARATLRRSGMLAPAGSATAVRATASSPIASVRRRMVRCTTRLCQPCHAALTTSQRRHGTVARWSEAPPGGAPGALGGLALEECVADGGGLEGQLLGVPWTAVRALDVTADGLVVGVEVDDCQAFRAAPGARVQGRHCHLRAWATLQAG